ncbi:hypothetical protein C7444_101255 [Sphaerotilus hippei]|uniref:Uncharacterized protein n=1 Tax=Sphaerotilus hippei TaxID=744406 RepID=A0A318H6C4_9BURK|nr:hypothetical protein [Sphaerotilus hippei]PXW99425.1 hypothetical protein C7444_101255 [Sphaerotilus hippei]
MSILHPTSRSKGGLLAWFQRRGGDEVDPVLGYEAALPFLPGCTAALPARDEDRAPDTPADAVLRDPRTP